MRRVLLLTTLMLTAILLTAQIVTDRPDQTESSLTVSQGSLQIESGILAGYYGNAFVSIRQLLLPTTLLRYGITDNIELRLVNDFTTLKAGNVKYDGIRDLQIGTKISLLNKEDKNAVIAFLTHLVVPTGSVEVSSDFFSSINKLCISHQLNKNLGLGYNIGYSYLGAEDYSILTYSISLAGSVNDKVGVYIEPYGEIIDLEESLLNFDAGFTYLANPNLQFDFSFGTGITNKMNYISIGCSWLMNKQKND